MSAEQLSRRIGVTKPRIYEIERSELSGSVTLDSLERVAHAMDCQLVYALIPRQELQTTVEQRALQAAKRRVRATSHSMALEDQAVESQALDEQVETLAKDLLKGRASRIWEEE